MPASKDDLLTAARRYQGLHDRMAMAAASGDAATPNLARKMNVAAVMLVLTALNCDQPQAVNTSATQ